MFDRLQTEYLHFRQQPRNFQALLAAMAVFSLILPINNVFLNAYVMRTSQNDVGLTLLFQLAVYTAVPFTSVLNGYLLRHVKCIRLYQAGMLMSSLGMLVMTSLPQLSSTGIIVAGLINGFSVGMFWPNRNLLTQESTADENRTYFYGVEMFLQTASCVIMPAIVGFFIARTGLAGYKSIALVTLALTLIAAVIIQVRFNSTTPAQRQQTKELPFSIRHLFGLPPLWIKILQLSALKGTVQGFIFTVPMLLTFAVLGGKEDLVGGIQSIGTLVTAFTLYLLGRLTHARHRIAIFRLAVWLFAVGALVNAGAYNKIGALVFIVLVLISQPLLDFAYFPIQMRVMDALHENTGLKRHCLYTYICSHEFGLYWGRLASCSFFIACAYYGKAEAAFRIALPIIGLVQVLSIPLARRILRSMEPESAPAT